MFWKTLAKIVLVWTLSPLHLVETNTWYLIVVSWRLRNDATDYESYILDGLIWPMRVCIPWECSQIWNTLKFSSVRWFPNPVLLIWFVPRNPVCLKWTFGTIQKSIMILNHSRPDWIWFVTWTSSLEIWTMTMKWRMMIPFPLSKIPLPQRKDVDSHLHSRTRWRHCSEEERRRKKHHKKILLVVVVSICCLCVYIFNLLEFFSENIIFCL